MAQVRVTDFYTRKKKGGGGPQKTVRQRGCSSLISSGCSSPGSETLCATFCPSTVRDEFIHVIDEAAGLIDVQPSGGSSVRNEPHSPRTPKRSSAAAALEAGSVVLSVSAEHSTAKKRRAAVDKAHLPERKTRRAAWRKLALPDNTPPAEPASPPGELGHKQPSGAAAPQTGHCDASLQGDPAPPKQQVKPKESTKIRRGDVSSLKARLQRIRKQAQEMDSAALSASVSTGASPSCPTSAATAPVPNTDVVCSDTTSLQYRLSRAKELAAEAQRREECKVQSKTPTQNSIEQPAYQRYHSLAQAAPPGLSLPYMYKVLAEMFRSMDTVVAMLYNRCETATFAKIQRGVQDMMHKRFEEIHVGQIKCVFPEAYAFRQEKNVPTFSSSVKKGSYQLTVEPVIPSVENEAHPVLSASCLLKRRRIFHLNLVSIVKEHHKVFLCSLAPPLSVPEDKLTRWHPRFNVDTVPPVQASALPPVPHIERPATAQEVLDRARPLITPKMEKALLSVTLKPKDEAVDSMEPSPPSIHAVPQKPSTPSAPDTQVPSALKGVSQSLLKRIRAKEAQKIQAAMTRDPIQDERLLMMSRLGELARILRSVFITEKKPALIMEVACNRMVASYRSALSKGDMEKHIRLLAEVTADWLSIHPIRKDFYLKLNKNMELNVVLDKVSRQLAEEERLQVDVTQS